MNCEEIIARLEEEYPLDYAMEWDNSGLQVGRRSRDVRKIFVALDADEETISEAVEFEADLLLTHHPLLFHSIRQVNDDTFIGRRILAMIEHEITCYAMHTNFDVLGMAGMNRRQLGLEHCRVLDVTRENEGVEEGIGRVGELREPMTLQETARYVRNSLQLQAVRCYGLPADDPGSDGEEDGQDREEKEPLIRRVAVCGGSGKSVVQAAIREGAQVLVTGDIDYHTACDALAQGLHVIDAGHYGTECGFIEFMVQKLGRLFPDCEVRGARIRQPYAEV